MSVAQDFEKFINNLAISNKGEIDNRYKEITKTLNKKFRNTESETDNCLQVGSFGRNTAINGISDLDMLYIMPKSLWNKYDHVQNGQYKLLADVKEAILNRYPRSSVSVGGLVVCITFSNFYIEVQPVFSQDDGSFKYPNTANGGSWKITKPREEITETSNADRLKNKNLRRLCKMVRSWKNKHGVAMGGLLIDTLAYNFLSSTQIYDNKSYSYYDVMSRDFFKFLSEIPEQTEYAALGSRQRVKVKKKFQKKAKQAYDLCIEAINADNTNGKWKKVYGRSFPAQLKISNESFSYQNYRNTEEFIEDKFPIDIREYLEIDCEIKQNGWRKYFLRDILRLRIPLKSRKELSFYIKETSVLGKYDIYWKVLNRGIEAEKRDCIRGQIVKDIKRKQERSDFFGNHIVECYCVQNGVVIARDRIEVPISNDGDDYE